MKRRPRRPVMHRSDWTDGLCNRTANALRAHGIASRLALEALPRQRLLQVPALGRTSLAEIDTWLGRSVPVDAPRRAAKGSRVASPLRLTLQVDAGALRSGTGTTARENVERAAQAITRELMRLLVTEGETDPPLTRTAPFLHVASESSRGLIP